MTSLRAQQRAIARQAIVQACADLVNDTHHLDFAVKDVAERAGVSLRTLYNYFPAREDLLDAVAAEVDRRMSEAGGIDSEDVASLADVLDAVDTNLALFEEMGGISEAVAQLPLRDVGRDGRRAERTRQLTTVLTDAMDSAPTREAAAVALLLRHVLSHRSWFWMTREYGLSTADWSALTRWTLTTLTAAVDGGDLPDLPDQPDEEER